MEGCRCLKASVAILNLIRASMESQWTLFRVDELESVKPTCDKTCGGGGGGIKTSAHRAAPLSQIVKQRNSL